MVAAGCLIPKNSLGAYKILSVNGLSEPPPPIVVVGPIPVGLALLSPAISNGTTRVMVLSRCIGSRGGGVVTHDIVGCVIIGIGPPSEPPLNTNNPLICFSLIRFICALKSFRKDLPWGALIFDSSEVGYPAIPISLAKVFAGLAVSRISRPYVVSGLLYGFPDGPTWEGIDSEIDGFSSTLVVASWLLSCIT